MFKSCILLSKTWAIYKVVHDFFVNCEGCVFKLKTKTLASWEHFFVYHINMSRDLGKPYMSKVHDNLVKKETIYIYIY
jgi:hypothetical protein